MNDIINSIKQNKSIVIFILILIVVVMVVFIQFLYMTYSTKPASTGNQTAALPTITSTVTPTSAPPEHVEFSGADTEAFQKYTEDHPEMFTEAQLKEKVPLEYDGFSLDFSYDQDKFIVTINSPENGDIKKFNDWFEKMGLKDRSHFEVKNQ